MKVAELIIDGFKSYATRTVISEWDPQFNAITGLNGSGKSNILDAICFVLGISSMSTVRASNLQDLIYKRGQAGVTKASVTIVFDNSDKSKAPIGFETSLTISVTRQIVLGGTSKYLINGHRAPQQSVLHLFQSVQLNINNPNFLIMQGKITKVLNMKPTEILALIEEAAGTKMFEDRREKAIRTMAKKETKLQENRTLLKEEIEPKLEKLRLEKRTFLDFQETQTDLEETDRVVNAYDYHRLKSQKELFKETLSSKENKIKDLNSQISKLAEELESLNEDFEEIRKKKNAEMDKNSNLSKLEEEENEIINETSKLNVLLKICSDNYKENVNKIQIHKKIIEDSSMELAKKADVYKKSKEDYKTLNDQLDTLKDLHKKKEDLLSTLSTGISSTGLTDGGYEAQLGKAKKSLNGYKISIKKSNMKIDLLRKELENNKPKLIQAEKENEVNIQNIKDCESNCSKLEADIANYGYDPKLIGELKRKENEIQQILYKLNNENEYLRRKVSNVDFSYSNPEPNFDPKSVKGVAARLFTIDKQNYDSATALQVCAGGRLYNVVVDNETTASKLLEKGRLRKRVTIIPLNKISARTIDNNTLNYAKQLAPGKVELALNLIGYEDEVAKALQFIFGSSLICNDAETAKKITFNPKIRTRSITLDGDVYDPEGTLSGGSRTNTSSILVDIQKYNESTEKINNYQNELKSIRKKLSEQEDIYKQTKELQNQLSLLNHKLEISKRNFGSNPASQVLKRNKDIQEEILICEKENETSYENSNALEKEIQSITKDLNEFNNDKGSKLKELKAEVEKLSKEIETKDRHLDDKTELFQTLELETEQHNTDIETNTELVKQAEDTLKELKIEEDSLIDSIKEQKNKLETVRAYLTKERKRLFDIDEETKDLERLLKSKHQLKNDNEIELQQLEHELKKFKNDSTNIEELIRRLIEENEWLNDDKLVEGVIGQHRGINLEEQRERAKQLRVRFDKMKVKVNTNIMSMIESVEKKEAALITMIKTIEKDKVKIQDTITKLNEYKRDTLIKTWKKVTVDFGNIFADLLPNSFAKLVPSEGKDITEGLEVKIKLGKLWKESLVELSGGQRSLIALSLIMALLQFRPAPMYILDEVDAALDLSHTQNIGHLIKTRFKGSQFIVVSLKEGMFNNANRVFRTRFQDGTSVVSIM
ncbi:hypothetical protein TPHA_0C04440 [Tetrapisispora phaffii CBS 4417]|uniref:Structural maintenance of chromosomes protein n=1 Tax=Tetrapisispora phaffii (strain ATCC 24235 / CBS 4417 / NBRC 1672 / NRRL Y-8282 / UCD 70-5) TaxID=1071381 RepID=G8BQT2_TETPH|nr:hypothetical protein TPHA_0C04440 [Tetrapisispora phaffii CBS 4417]CCE62594.1 hypothetical protein TPHA_0C04440 [Tetrapisispora phaffii CBS 4417]